VEEKNLKEIFSVNILLLRKSKNMTQGDLADVLGVGISTVSDWEKGKKYPRSGATEKISEYFNVSKSRLFEEAKSVSDLYEDANEISALPIVGGISCGNGTIAYENIDGYEDTPKSWVRGGEFFYLRASGDSMINARIFDGDLLLIRKQEYVEDGEIAAVLIDDEVFLKRVYKNDDTLILQSENPTYPQITKTASDHQNIRVIGKLKRIIIKL
jgi:repressor LexA